MTQAPVQTPFVSAPVGSMEEAETLITHIMQVMDAVLNVVEDETNLVRAGKLSAAARLVSSKNELSQLYLADAQRLKISQSYLARTMPDILEALRKRHDLFQAVLQMNLTVLATAHAVSEGIMRGVSDEMAKKTMPAGYGASGRTTTPPPRHAQPLAVSRVL
jgi:flagellar biosynthesis/type III secretory pathway chaperone